MILCNLFKCDNSCGLEPTQRDIVIIKRDIHFKKRQDNKKIDISSIKHSRKSTLSFKNRNIRLKQNNEISPITSYEPFRRINKRQIQINNHQKHQNSTYSINPILISKQYSNMKKQNEKHYYIYPINLQKQANNQQIKQNIQQSNRQAKTFSYSCTPLQQSRKVSLASLQTTTGQTHLYLQQKNIINKQFINQKSLPTFNNSHVQSINNMNTFQSSLRQNENKLMFNNNNAMYLKQKEEKFDNFVIFQNNESSLSMLDQSSNLLNAPKNSLNLAFKNKKNINQEKDENKLLSSIKFIKQEKAKKKQVKFNVSSYESSLKVIDKQQRQHNIFRIVDTIKSINQSVPSIQNSYLDLYFMNNLSSRRLFSKLM